MTRASHPALHPVRRARKSRGWGLRELAARVGMDPGNLSKIETGRRRVGPAAALRLGRELGISPYELVDEEFWCAARDSNPEPAG